MKTFSSVLYFLFIALVAFGSDDTLSFVSPVDHKIRLSGNYMELRTNHFHAGIDIKSSKGLIGDPIRAVSDGYVSRIKIESGGYGQVLYIDHPNGLTSVYAHLDKFNPEIEAFVKSAQYSLKSFELDLYLPDSLIQVKQSQLIANMGNKGRSYGPHLHFELRDTKSEKPINPEKYGIGPEDDIAPTLEHLKVYSLGEDHMIIDRTTKYFKRQDQEYSLYGDLSVAADSVAFGLLMFDRMNGSSNKNGVYGFKLYENDSMIFEWKAEEFAFSENKKINGFIDYRTQISTGHKIYRLFSPPCGALDAIEELGQTGIIHLENGLVKPIKIEAFDLYGNTSVLQFNLKKDSVPKLEANSKTSCFEAHQLKKGMFEVNLPSQSFFEPVELDIEVGKSKIFDTNCHSIQIGEATTPIRSYYTISTPIPEDYSDQWTFVTTDKKGRFIHFGADTLNGRMYAQVDQLGEYFVYKDKIAPKIQTVNLEAGMERPWKVKISDNLIPDGKVRDLDFYASVNGEWICFEYDLKSDLLIFDDFEKIQSETIDFELVVRDNQGNETRLNRQIR